MKTKQSSFSSAHPKAQRFCYRRYKFDHCRRTSVFKLCVTSDLISKAIMWLKVVFNQLRATSNIKSFLMRHGGAVLSTVALLDKGPGVEPCSWLTLVSLYLCRFHLGTPVSSQHGHTSNQFRLQSENGCHALAPAINSSSKQRKRLNTLYRW